MLHDTSLFEVVSWYLCILNTNPVDDLIGIKYLKITPNFKYPLPKKNSQDVEIIDVDQSYPHLRLLLPENFPNLQMIILRCYNKDVIIKFEHQQSQEEYSK
jgi:hypothetical protein